MGNSYSTYWQINKRSYPSKRYVLIFDKYRNYDGKKPSITEYDNLNDLHEEIKLLNEYYKDTPQPVLVQKRYGSSNTYSFSGDAYFWGYIVLDFETQKIIESGNDGINVHYQYGYKKIKGKSIGNNIKDFFFRKDDEIPKNYHWDIGEYEGWLQYRWGDGKNAVNYIGDKKELPGHIEYVNVYDDVTDSYIKKKVRVVDVDWNEPLPERIKGIYYRRPNKEPVKFPGEYGYDNDYSLWPWALTEEIAEEEYIDNGNTLDKKETTSSIADMLGEDNPLLKLKFD